MTERLCVGEVEGAVHQAGDFQAVVGDVDVLGAVDGVLAEIVHRGEVLAGVVADLDRAQWGYVIAAGAAEKQEGEEKGSELPHHGDGCSGKYF